LDSTRTSRRFWRNIETSHDVGETSMLEIVEEANKLGYEYVAFTEHNPSKSKHNEREVFDLLKRKKEAIEKINSSIVKRNEYSIHKVFNSLEIDILPSGELAIPDKGLEFIDFALVSIHSAFDLDRDQMTKRVLLALDHPKTKIFAHPTARKLTQREGVELDWPQIFEFCLKNDKFIEINADPMRLDLPDTLVREAVKKGVKFSLGTDAHNKDGLNNMRYGISVARRGWATKKDIINTLSLKDFEKVIK